MIKRLISFIIAAAAAVSVSLSANAANEQEKLNYIYTDIKENYISDYRLYEQVMYGQVVFYTNVSNGDITSDGVVIELPANVDATLERDGTEIKFTNKAEITQLGSYALTVIAKGTDILGGAENDRYYGLFRFRIMEAAASVVTTPSIEVNEWETSEDVYTVPSLPVEIPAEATEEPSPAETAEQTAEAPAATDSTVGTTGTSATTAATASGTAATSEDTADPKDVPLGDTSLISADSTETNVRLETAAGTEIFTNIPPYMKTTGKVEFTFTQDVQYKLYKDSAIINGYTAASAVSEKGKYQLFIYDGSGDLPAEFDFEITGDYIAGITQYTVPEGCLIERALFEGNMIRSNRTSVDLGAEGTYSVDIAYGLYVFTETFILDNTAPLFSFDRVQNGIAEGGTVTIIFQSDDIDSYEVFLDGKMIEAKKRTISEPGKYTVRVYDRAGNMSEQSFELLYKMNGMAIVVVLLLIGIVIAAAVFFVTSRRKFIIR